MSETNVMDIMRQMLLVCMQIAGPVLLVSVVVGLIIAIFQAATQIHEQTLTFVPKVLMIALALLLLGSFIGSVIIEFVQKTFALMATV